MSEIDNSEVQTNADENITSPLRPDRMRTLSLKATESFDLSRQSVLDKIDKNCTKIDKFLDSLENENDPELAKKVFNKARYQFSIYTSNCTKLLNICTSADTTEAQLLHKKYLEEQNLYSRKFYASMEPFAFLDNDNGSIYVPSEQSLIHTSSRQSVGRESARPSRAGSERSSASHVSAAKIAAAQATARLDSMKKKAILQNNRPNLHSNKLLNRLI